MRRREFIAGISSAAALPVVARAQQSQAAVVGFLSAGAPEAYRELMLPFHRGLQAVGYIDGQNLTVEARYAEGDFSLIPQLAIDLTRRGAAVIVTTGTTSTLGAKKGAPNAHLVFLTQVDPVNGGLVASLPRPGGNATGIYLVSADLVAKRLEFARQVAPGTSPITLIVNPKGGEYEVQFQEAKGLSSDARFQTRILNASTPDEIDIAFAALAHAKTGALLIGSDPLFFSRRDQIVALARRAGVPAIYDRREYATAGGLMSYGTNLADAFARLGLYTGKILKGARPADLPVEQAARFEFVLNLKTAKSLGLTLPPSLLALADEVIE
jgi:putative tryptophan/tyrosine transport system substrate-binding protein